MADIVKYHNDMNSISLSGMTEKELNIFFSICFKMKNTGEEEILLSFSELKELSKGDSNLPRFLNALKSTYTKLLTIPYFFKNEQGFGAFVLFNKYFVNEQEKTVKIKVSSDFKYLLNDFFGNYTKFDLLEFVSLKSIYSKNLFKVLKQWESKKEKKFEIEEFRSLMGVPIKYSTANFNDRVLKPIMQELPKYFSNLKLEKIKTGKKVTDLKFTWKIKKEVIEAEVVEVKISEKLNKAIEKAKKNRFIANLFTDENIEKLISKFEEPVLIKGLSACYKDIQKDVKSLNYLIKAIETAAGKKTKKIVVEKEKTDQEKSKSISKEKVPTVQKIKVLESELKKAYKHYLIKNKLSDNPFTKKAFTMNYEIVEKIELSEKLKKLIKENSITEEDIIDGISAGYEREDVIEILADDRSYKPSPDELQKEYEEFLAWKKWNEERTNKK
ncbi:replication initiation protein [Fusobacterium sp. THCT1E2]